jgi:hypothetical protein
MSTVPKDPTTEIVDRLRRIETRLTKFLELQGIDTGVQRCTFENGWLVVPSPAASMKDMRAAVPDTWPLDKPVAVYCHGEWMGDITFPSGTTR